MGIRVNMADVQTGFEALPSGTYIVNVTDGEIKESGENSKNPGSEYINWELTVQSPAEFEGRKLWYMTSLLPHALFGLKGLLVASQKFTNDQLSGDLDFEIDDVIGAQIKVTVKQKTYEGELRNEVKNPRSVGEEDMVESSMLP